MKILRYCIGLESIDQWEVVFYATAPPSNIRFESRDVDFVIDHAEALGCDSISAWTVLRLFNMCWRRPVVDRFHHYANYASVFRRFTARIHGHTPVVSMDVMRGALALWQIDPKLAFDHVARALDDQANLDAMRTYS